MELAKKRTVGDPFAGKYDQGPQVLGCCSKCTSGNQASSASLYTPGWLRRL